MKAERERKDTVAALERQLTAARAEVLDWRRELAAAEAERDRLMTDKKALAKRASSGSLYAGYGGTPKARGCPPALTVDATSQLSLRQRIQELCCKNDVHVLAGSLGYLTDMNLQGISSTTLR